MIWPTSCRRWSENVLAYNLKPILNILGITQVMNGWWVDRLFFEFKTPHRCHQTRIWPTKSALCVEALLFEASAIGCDPDLLRDTTPKCFHTNSSVCGRPPAPASGQSNSTIWRCRSSWSALFPSLLPNQTQTPRANASNSSIGTGRLNK